MILESEDEKNAFNFIYNIASETLGNAGCNDLDSDMCKKFSHLKVPSDDELRPIIYDFDILFWLKNQLREPTENDKTQNHQ